LRYKLLKDRDRLEDLEKAAELFNKQGDTEMYQFVRATLEEIN
jgi:hypothetical protein